MGERYELYGYEEIKDTKTNVYLMRCGSVDRLNQQDRRIKELEQSKKQLAIDKLEMLNAVFASTIIDEVLRNYVCSIIGGEIEILIGEENEKK